KMLKLVDTFHNGKILHDGIAMCLIGCPNVGKSSLMNVLLDKDRAIVTPLPGTTRDILEDHLRLNGLNFKLIDTAGIREGAEIVEQEGIRRSKVAMKSADLILLVLDTQRGIEPEDKAILDAVPKNKTIVIWNKIDLKSSNIPSLEFPHIVAIS